MLSGGPMNAIQRLAARVSSVLDRVLVAAELLLLPIVIAKALAIGASFLVNFSLARFVVFRPRSLRSPVGGEPAPDLIRGSRGPGRIRGQAPRAAADSPGRLES